MRSVCVIWLVLRVTLVPTSITDGATCWLCTCQVASMSRVRSSLGSARGGWRQSVFQKWNFRRRATCGRLESLSGSSSRASRAYLTLSVRCDASVSRIFIVGGVTGSAANGVLMVHYCCCLPMWGSLLNGAARRASVVEHLSRYVPSTHPPSLLSHF